jgi:probable HAF family extracellular repeat protein
MKRIARACRVCGWVALLVWAPSAGAQLKINEVYYNVSSQTNQEAKQYIEIYNAGTATAFLDGLILTDEAADGIEGVFRFPGTGSTFPVPAGEFVLIAADADSSDPFPPNLGALAAWECYAGTNDYDNPAVSNLTLVAGQLDLNLNPGGDNVILATGADLVPPIDPSTIIDGMNFNWGGGELANLSTVYGDETPTASSAKGLSLQRCPDGNDSDSSSASDFTAASFTPGFSNPGGCPPIVVVRDASVNEGTGGTTNLTFIFTRSSGEGVSIVEYGTSNGTAVAGADFVAVPPTQVSFSSGVRTQIVSVTIQNDALLEPDEFFYLQVTPVQNASIARPRPAGRIVDNDIPGFSITDSTGPEGVGTNAFLFIISLPIALTNAASVEYSTEDGTALAGEDYEEVLPLRLTFNPGQKERVIGIRVFGDTQVESNKVFYVNLSNPSNAVLSDARGVGTILNDDSPPVMSVSMGDATVTEGDAGTTSAVFRVSLNLVPTQNVSIVYATSNGTAVAGTDYIAVPNTPLAFTPGQTSKTVSVSVLGETLFEPNEVFYVNILSASNALIARNRGTGTILNNDPLPPPQAFVGDTSVRKPEAGTTGAAFRIWLSTNSASTITLRYSTSNGTAVAGVDYVVVPSSLMVFTPGVTAQTVSVTVNGNTNDSGNLTFFLNLASPSNAVITDGQGVGTILGPTAAPYGVVDLGTLGGNMSRAFGINDRGEVVGQARDAAGQDHAFLWRTGTLSRLLASPAFTNSLAYDVNRNGNVSGYLYTNGLRRAFLFSNSVLRVSGALPGGTNSQAYGLNKLGQIAGHSELTNASGVVTHPAVVFAGGLVDLGTFDGAANGEAYDINNNGVVVGYAHILSGGSDCFDPFAWQDANGNGQRDGAEMQNLGTLGGRAGQASGVNDLGQVVGYAYTNGLDPNTARAFLVTPAGGRWDADLTAGTRTNPLMVQVGTLGGPRSEAWAINDSGVIVGSADNASTNRRAFSYFNGVVSDLNDLIPNGTGWLLTDARDVNNSGQIVGWGQVAGQTRAFLLTPSSNEVEMTRVAFTPTGGATRVTVQWRGSGSNLVYTVEESGSVLPPAWTTVAPTGQWPQLAPFWSTNVPSGATDRYFRVKGQPQSP